MPIDKDLWDLFVQFEENKERATERAKAICSDFLGPAWMDKSFIVEKLSGGMTNLVYKCSIPDQNVLLRVQCDKDVMQLQNELIILMKLAERNLGPKLLGVFPGGRLEEFIPSRILTYDECRNPGYSQHIARTMAKIHQVDVPLSRSSQLISTLRQWIERIKKNGGDEFELWSKNASIPEDKFPKKINLASMREEIDQIEKYLKNNNSPNRLTHNDLFATNILLRDGYKIEDDGTVKMPPGGKEEDPLVIIDFEFGMYNYRGFDIGNHLNELGLTYFEEMPTYSFDLAKLTDKSLHRNYCTAYLNETYAALKKMGRPLEEECLTGDLNKDSELLEKEAVTFQAIANFWWGIWNIICDQEGIVGMDFYNAFRDRLCLYYYLKNF